VRERITGIQIGKEDLKLSLLADFMIPYLNDLKDSTRKLLDLIYTLIKAAGHKINI
jgi:hypothetical protein